ncbi:MAG: MBL fold metallo-hydrolase, partial [Gammaproteobacteria bacterium]|nr:MBL fold metallo-hydrolase [Gammaproteobacteria bacterium]
MRERGMARLGTLVLASVVAVAVLVGGGYWFLVRTAAGQDFLLGRMAGAVLSGGLPSEFDGLRVFMCGTSGPLAAPGRAQTCVAVTAGDSLYLFDAGEGSADVAQLHGLPTETLRAIFVTHMHSDHIAGINNFNLASWVQGRPAPLKVMGPAGIERVVAGFNEAFAIDRGYRVAHHGNDFLPAELGVMHAEVIAPGVVLQDDGLRVTAFAVDHGPVKPAYGFRIDYRGRSAVVGGDTIGRESLTVAA